MSDQASGLTQQVVAETKRKIPAVPEIDRDTRGIEPTAGRLHTTAPQVIAGRLGMPHDASVCSAEWIRHGAPRAGAKPAAQHVASTAQLGLDFAIVEPGDTPMGGAM